MLDKQTYNDISIVNFISIFYRIGTSYLSRKYEKYNIGYGQYQFLVSLYFEDGLSQDELTKRIAVDKATTTRAINKLKESGYVTVSIDSSDKRVHRVLLTQKALDTKDEILKISHEWEDKLLGSLTEEDKKIVQSLFNKIAIDNGWLL